MTCDLTRRCRERPEGTFLNSSLRRGGVGRLQSQDILPATISLSHGRAPAGTVRAGGAQRGKLHAVRRPGANEECPVRSLRIPRVRRKLYLFFSALSLLLCLAVCVLWVRSYI